MVLEADGRDVSRTPVALLLARRAAALWREPAPESLPLRRRRRRAPRPLALPLRAGEGALVQQFPRRGRGALHVARRGPERAHDRQAPRPLGRGHGAGDGGGVRGRVGFTAESLAKATEDRLRSSSTTIVFFMPY